MPSNARDVVAVAERLGHYMPLFKRFRRILGVAGKAWDDVLAPQVGLEPTTRDSAIRGTINVHGLRFLYPFPEFASTSLPFSTPCKASILSAVQRP